MYESVWPCMTLNDSVGISFNWIEYFWLYVILFDSVWLKLILFCSVWLCLAWLDLDRLCLTLCLTFQFAWFLLFNFIQLCINLIEFVKLCSTLFNSSSYAQILCLLYNTYIYSRFKSNLPEAKCTAFPLYIDEESYLTTFLMYAVT